MDTSLQKYTGIKCSQIGPQLHWMYVCEINTYAVKAINYQDICHNGNQTSFISNCILIYHFHQVQLNYDFFSTELDENDILGCS